MTSPGRYQFHELIATGGMGEVWRATDTVLRRDVAIKLLKPEYADDTVSRSRFESEARHAAALHHPHVAAVYDVGEMPTASGLMRPYLVMELVDGKPLSDLIQIDGEGHPLDPEVVRDLLGQAGDAIAAAHRAGIVHRDIKPANLLVTPDRQVKVTDFGISRAASSSSFTSTGQVMGTPQYLSPEQARGELATPASDVYALGIVAWECLVGHRPFQKETPVATAIAHLHDPVPPLPDSVPPDLAAVVMRALDKDPAKRYADAAAFTAALRGLDTQRTDTPAAGTALGLAGAAGAAAAAAGGAAAAAEGQTQAIPTTTVVPRPPSAPASGEISEEPARRKRRWWQLGVLNWVLIVLALLVLLAIALLGWFVTHGDSSTPTVVQHSPSASPTVHRTKAAKTFDLPSSCYAGWTVSNTAADLRKQGLNTRKQAVPDQSGHTPDTVQYVTPCRDVSKGDTIVIKYFAAAPSSAPPTTSPTPSETPTAPSSPTSTVTVTPSPTSTATTSPSGATTAGSAGVSQQ